MLSIPASVAEELLAHARAELPNEACGLLAGSRAEARVTAFHPARNAEASPFRYDVHPEDLVRIVFGIEAVGEDLLAVFHSHLRSPAVPSATDRRLAHDPGAYQVLATLVDPGAATADALRAWTLESDDACEVPIVIG